MIRRCRFLPFFLLMLMGCCNENRQVPSRSDFVIYAVDRSREQVEMFWKDGSSRPLKSIRNLRTYIDAENRDLKFAMNGGMFIEHNIPKGLYIENSRILNPADTLHGKGNFYLQPNGIFYGTTSGNYVVVPTKNFRYRSNIQFATQSGPILVYNGAINPVFHQNSSHVNVRNGVGISKDGNPVFVMSKSKVSFYRFAQVFKSLGCENALYLDGFVSRAYFPDGKWLQEDGDFGAMIGVIQQY